MARLMLRLLAFLALLGVCTTALAEPVTGTVLFFIGTYGVTVGTVLTVLSVASTVYGAVQAKKKQRAAAQRLAEQEAASLRDRTTNVISAESPWPTIYGAPAPVGGSIVAVLTSGDRDQYKHVVMVLAAHECDGVDAIYCAGEHIGNLTAAGYADGANFQLQEGVTHRETLAFKLEELTYERESGSGTYSGGWFLFPSDLQLQRGFFVESILDADGNPMPGVELGYAPNSITGQHAITGPIGTTGVITYLVDGPGSALNVQVHLSPGGVDVADPFLRAARPDLWTEDHRLSGCTYLVLTLNLLLERFQGGVPEITVKVRGKKVYDPRTGLTAFSRNPALCLADFLQSEVGYRASSAQIELDTLIASANACDVAVYDAGSVQADPATYGGSQARYTCDGMFRSDQDRDATRQQIEDSMVGHSLESAGVWRILAGAWTTPVLALTDDDMVAPTSVVQTCNAGTAHYNGARGTYANAVRNGVTEDFALFQNPTFRALDEKDKLLDLTLSFTSNHVRTQQIARVLVEQSRGGFVVQIHPMMFAWGLQPGDRVVLSSVLYGFTNKTFRVQDWTYSQTTPLALQLVEDEESYYDQADETRADAAPNTSLPSPFIKPLAPMDFSVQSGVEELLHQGASVIVRAYLRWADTAPAAVRLGGAVQVRLQPLGADGEQQTIDLPGDAVETYALGLVPGREYLFRIRFVTAFVSSDWAQVTHRVEGMAPSPSNVQGLTLSAESAGIVARWSEPTDLDLLAWGSTQLRYGSTWEAGAEIYRGKTTATNTGWWPAGKLVVWAAHANVQGVVSTTPVSAQIDVAAPLQPIVQGEVWRDEITLTWQDCKTMQPLARYEVRRGATFAVAELLAEGQELRFVARQPVGTYLFWVDAIDVAGNRSMPGYVELTVTPGIDEALEELHAGLDDLVADLAIQSDQRQQADAALAQQQAQEADNRAQADAALAQTQAQEAQARAQADATAAQNLAAEAQARSLAVNVLLQSLSDEQAERVAAVAKVQADALAGIAGAKAELAASIAAVGAQVADIVGATAYSASTAYAQGALVEYADKLYRARQNTIGNLPTNATYWELVGDYASIGQAVVAHSAQLSDHETRITQTAQGLTAEARDRNTLAAQIRGDYTGNDPDALSQGLAYNERVARAAGDSANASLIQGVDSRLQGAQGQIAGQGTAINGLLTSVGQVNDKLAVQSQRIDTVTAMAGTRPNLLPNGGFERGAQGWPGAAGWSIGASGYWGQVAMRAGVSGTGVLESDPFPVSEGAPYVITADTLLLGATAGGVFVDVQFRAANGSVLLDGDQRIVTTLHDFSAGYATRDLHAVASMAPPGAVKATARFVYYNVVGTYVQVGVRQIKVERGDLPATAYSSEAGQSAEASAVGALTGRITAAEGSISVQSGRLTSLESRASTNEGQVAANAGAIGSLNSQVEIINGTLASQASDIVTLQATTATRPNLVANGNFERGLEGMFSAAGWSVQEGAWGCTATATLNGTGSLDWPRFAVFRDQVYTAAADSLLFAASGAVVLGLMFYDGTGAVAADRQGPPVAATHDFSASGTNRRAHAFQTTAPANAVAASVRFIYREVVGCQVMGVRLVKVERGGLPATAYSSEAYDTASGAATSALTTRVALSEGAITSQSGQLTSLADRLTNAEGSASANSSAISGLNSQVSSINGTLSTQAGQLTSLTGRIGAAEGTGTANSGAIQSLNTRMSSAEGALSAQSASLTSLGNRITAAEGTGTANSGAIQSLNSQVSSINGALSSQSGQLTSLTSRIGSAETTIGSQGTAIAGLTTQVSQVKGTVDVQTSDITRLKAFTGTRPNLLPNGGFERGAQGWPGAAGWSIGTSGYWGQVAMRAGASGTGALESDPFPISEGAIYTITADTLLLGATGGGVYVDLQYRAANGSVLLDGDQRMVSTLHDFSAGYGVRDQHAVAMMAPANAVKATARFVYSGISGANVQVGVRQMKVECGELPATAYTTEAGQSAESSAVGALTARVSTAEGSITSQSGQIVSLGNRITAAEGTGTANSGAIQSLNSQVSSINGTLSSQSGQLTSLTSRIGSAETNIGNQGTAIAGLNTQVSQLNGTVAVQSSNITSLQASTATRPNLLVNGNFEAGLTGIGNTPNWFVDDGAWGRSARSGSVSGTGAIDWPVLPVSGGAQYTMAADTLLFASAGSLRLGVIYYTEAGAQLADLQGPSRFANHDFSADSTGRNLIALAMQAPANAAKAVPRLIYDSIAGLQVVGVRLVKFERGGLPATRYSAERQDTTTGTAVQSLTSRLNAAEGSITSQSGALTSLGNRIGTAEGGIASQSGAIQSLDSQVSSINGTLSSQSGQLTSLTSRIGSAETNIGNQGTAIAGLNTQVSQLNGTVAVQSQQLTSLTARAGSRPNELVNGGFERGLDGMSQVQAGWQIDNGIWGRTAIHRGVYGTGTLDWPAIPVQQGAVYTMTGDTLLFAGAGVCRFGMLFYNGAGALLSDAQGEGLGVNHDFSVDDSNRQVHAFQALAPAGATKVVPRFIYVGVDGINVIGCRMVKVERGGLPSTPYSAEALLSAEAGALQSLTARVTTTEGTVNNQAAAITWLDGRITSAEGTGSANVGAISSLNTQVQSINGALSAQSQSLQQLTASVNGNSASISTQSQALASLTGSVRATWRLNVDANGKTSGIILDNNGQTSNLVMVVDRFAIAQQIGGETKYPFTVGLIDGVSSFGIAGNMYIDGSIKVRMLDVDRLGAITANLGRVTTGQLDIYHDGDGGDGFVRSAGYWYRNGTNGWILGRNNSGTTYVSFRGGPCELWMHSSGDAGWSSPGISMTSGGLTINQVDVMGTLQLRGNSITVPVSSSAGSQVGANGNWQDVLDCYVSMPYGGILYANFTAIQGFPAGARQFALAIFVDGNQWFSTGVIGPALQPLIGASVANPVGAGTHRVLVQWLGEANAMQLGARTLFAQGTMR